MGTWVSVLSGSACSSGLHVSEQQQQGWENVLGNYVVNFVFLFRQGWEWEPIIISISLEKNTEAFMANCLIVFTELILK